MEGAHPSSASSASLMERKHVNVAGMLAHFKNLITLATTPAGDGESKEIAAAHALQMEVETNALVQCAEELLKLTRELKELWLAGPLRELGEGEAESQAGEDAKKVAEMVDGILKKASELRFANGVSKVSSLT